MGKLEHSMYYAGLPAVPSGIVGGWPGSTPRFLPRTAAITAAIAYVTEISASRAVSGMRAQLKKLHDPK